MEKVVLRMQLGRSRMANFFVNELIEYALCANQEADDYYKL